jgi:hypothetical protein
VVRAAVAVRAAEAVAARVGGEVAQAA